MGDGTSYLAFLRAVNVGGRKVEMDRLRRLAEDLGFRRVRTVLNSGNVVLRADGRDPRRIERRLEDGCRDALGLTTDVIVRAAPDLAATLARNPFPRFAKDDPAHLLVVLLKDEPTPSAARAFAGDLPGPEEGRVVGAHAFVTYPAGIGTSRLTLPRIEEALGTRGTGRNWNTVSRLLRLAAE